MLAEDSKQSGQGLKKASNECLSSYKTNPLYQNQMHNQIKEMDNFRMLEVDRSIENAVDWKKSVKVDTFKEKELNIYKGIQVMQVCLLKSFNNDIISRLMCLTGNQ